MKIYFSLLVFSFLFESCQDSQNKNKVLDSLNKVSSTDSNRNDFDTSKISMKDRINKLIEISAIKEFKSSRQELVDQGAKYQYQITEIKQFGKSYNYNVSIPNTDIQMDYTCIPESGELLIYMIGEKTIIQTQYDLMKVQNDWDNCRRIEEGEMCERDKKDEQYPIRTHILLSISKSDSNEAILNFRRKSKPTE